MFRNTLRVRFGLLLVLFFALVIAAVGMTMGSLRTQEKDALIINLAGRQRMLTQQMTWMALEQPDDPALSQNMTRFEQTLTALKDGGQTTDAFGRVVVLPPAPDDEIQTLLDHATNSWHEFQENIFRLQTLNDASTDSNIYTDNLEASSQRILEQLDRVVSAFEVHAQRKVARLWAVQSVFLGAALGLLLVGTFFIRNRLVTPLEKLGRIARRIGVGALSTAVPRLDKDELGELAEAMELMRQELSASQKQLQNRVEQRTNELVEAFEFSKEIVTQLELENLLQSVTDRCQKLMQAREARLCLIRSDGRNLELVASQGVQLRADRLYQPVELGIALNVIGNGKTVISEEQNCASCVYMRGHSPGTCVAAPLKTGLNTLGALCVVREHQSPFSTEEVQALTLLANIAAIAITNARLIEEERRQARKSAVLIERQRLAAELHDNLAQTLSFLRLKIEQINKLVQPRSDQILTELHGIHNTLDTAYHQVRDVIVGLTPETVETESLYDRLARCIYEFETISALPIQFTSEAPREIQLSPVAQNQVLYIVRESLANIQRHAQASNIVVHLDCSNGDVRCEVHDNGRGFDLHKDLANDQLGLRIMSTRAERVGGNLVIHSVPGEGTSVVLTLPVTQDTR